ncbi:ABC transporter [Agreia pratensis]|uniref:ABC transporter n=1 Tax=Agreia pratensis TaxID=150121 RepID=A0A1X7L448_9MICO|nr:ATP-binding cassette domain-containing protein [Agreia pratensis]SMG48244.1 ABC transporter [Agreia pratensis]
MTHSYIDVLRDIHLELSQGETAAVVGASGAGKSTLAALAVGVHEPAKGSMQREGSVVLVPRRLTISAVVPRADNSYQPGGHY